MALQADGKLVDRRRRIRRRCATSGRVVRLGPHGRLDPTFGSHGKLVTDFGPGFDEANAVAVQSNGKLLVAGRIREEDRPKDDMALVRLKPRRWSRSHVRGRWAGAHRCRGRVGRRRADLAIATNGKIVVTGEATVDRIRRVVVARYLFLILLP